MNNTQSFNLFTAQLHMHAFPCDISELFWMLHFFLKDFLNIKSAALLPHLLQLMCNFLLCNPFRHSDVFSFFFMMFALG